MIDRQFFAAFHKAAVAGTGTAFERIVRKHAPERVCGFCLYSDDDAQSLCTLAATREALGHPANFFDTAGWPYDQDELVCLGAAGEEQERCYREFTRLYKALRDTDPDRYGPLWEQYRMGVFETVVSAMETVIANGGFGDAAARDRLFLYFDVTDSEVDEATFKEWTRRLNTPKMFDEYQKGESSAIVSDWATWSRS